MVSYFVNLSDDLVVGVIRGPLSLSYPNIVANYHAQQVGEKFDVGLLEL